MSVDANGDIWAGSSSNNPCLLVVLDRSTGNVKEDYFGSGIDYLKVDNSSFSSLRFDAMAFHPITNQLYANMNGLSQNYDYLFKINSSNGAMTLVRQFNQMSDVEGMAFDAKGDLYVATGSNATNNSDDNKMWKVNLVNGNVTEQYGLGGGDVETCDCVIGDPISAVEISGTVFYDKNENGSYGSGDFENTSIEVSLYEDVNTNGTYESGTDNLVETTTTLANGSYFFKVVYGSGTERYLLRIDTTTLPTGSDFFGSDVLAVTITGGNVQLSQNDFGYESDIINAFEGYAFSDADSDTIFDSWELPISGVRIRLFEDDNCNGIRNSGDAQLDSTVVGTDGRYVFLQPYTSGGSNVCFITEVDLASLPTGSSLTTDNSEVASFTSGGNADQNNNFGISGGAVTALPVEWVHFDATSKNTNVELEWVTATEENNSHFEIQRSVNGDIWETLGQLNGMGNTLSITTYNFVDVEPHVGVNQYRIKQVDFDGRFEYSKTIGINHTTQTMINEIKLFPNPSQQNVNISWKSKLLNGFVELLDLNGQVTKSYKIQNAAQTRMDVSDMQNGVYYFKVYNDDFESVKPLIIVR